MPDGGLQTNFVYRPAKREKTAPLIMVAGPPGAGKTLSALRLARGLVGPAGKIYLADTDNGRALFYADQYQFEHLNLHEPFRPMIFEGAAAEAQKQGADVLIVDNFMHEHIGPGGLLEWHEEINIRMAKGDPAKLDTTKMLAWIEPKQAHKRMRERLYQLNMPVILCCGAEHKIAMVKQTEGSSRGKTIPVDQGLVPICGSDIPWAMTLSVMLPEVGRPGVPVPIKALLPQLIPIIGLDRPLDEATGAAIAAWSHGQTPAISSSNPPVNPAPQAEKKQPKRQVDDAEITAGAQAIAQRFRATKTRAEHLAIVDEPATRKQIDWLKKNRHDIYNAEIYEALTQSWRRTDPAKKTPAEQQGLGV